MDFGEAITRWTIRLALLTAAVALAALIDARRKGRSLRFARAAWTLSFLLYLRHVAAAFHFVHAWSHAAAYRETARQTKELFGLDWGGGLWFNYALTIAWLADVAWWWRGFEIYSARPRWISTAWYVFFIFMAVNGAMVFAEGPVRWTAVAVGAVLGGYWVRSPVVTEP